MLPPQQIAQAAQKLKTFQLQEEIKNKNKKFNKSVNDAINSIKQEPKKQLQIIRNLINADVLQKKIASFEALTRNLQELQQKMNKKREQLNKEQSLIVQQAKKVKTSTEQIKQNMSTIIKTDKETLQQGAKQRKKLEHDLEKFIDEVDNKTIIVKAEAQKLCIENAELQEKVNKHKGKFHSIEEIMKVRNEIKDQQLKVLRQELIAKLKQQKTETQKIDAINKQYAAFEKRNFDNKIALFVKTKQFPQFSLSFKGYANTLNNCKEELINSIHRINLAEQQIQYNEKLYEQLYNLQLNEMRKQQVLERKIEEVIKETNNLRAHITQLQNKLKVKKPKKQT